MSRGQDDNAKEAVLNVRVTPRAGSDELTGWQDGVLRVRLKAPPVEGQANEALLRFLAGQLGVPSSALDLVSGATGRHKRVRVRGLTEEEVRERLA